MPQKLEEGDVVLCTVDRIMGTVVFVNIEGGGEGSIILSEIAPGRIRNLRDYVVPKKKIVCKILRIKDNQIHLSLRRVTQKEQKEITEEYKQEKSSKSILRTVLKDRAKTAIEHILKQERGINEFLEEAKENPKKLEKLIGKADSEKILNILNTQKKKSAVIKREFNLTTTNPEGVILIKKILEKVKDAEIKYISAGKYSIKTEAEDMKTTDNKLKEILSKIEDSAKKQSMEFSIK